MLFQLVSSYLLKSLSGLKSVATLAVMQVMQCMKCFEISSLILFSIELCLLFVILHSVVYFIAFPSKFMDFRRYFRSIFSYVINFGFVTFAT